MYRNYDGNKSTFGDTSVSTSVANPDHVSAFAAQRASDGALTVMVVCKHLGDTTPVSVNLANFTANGPAQVWQFTSANTIDRLADATVGNGTVSLTAPPQSVTLLVIPGTHTTPWDNTPTGTTARYSFESNAQDGSGHNFHGTPQALTYTSGKIGSQAAQFNGSDASVTIPASITDDFTVAMWVKTTDTAGTAGSQWWTGKGLVDGEIGGGGADWGTSIVGGKFVLGVGAASGDVTVASSADIHDGAWHHVVATRENASGAMRVYVDGVLSGSGTGPTGSRNWPTSLRIGGLLPGSNFLNGAIDEMLLYDRLLSVDEIRTLAANPQNAEENWRFQNFGATANTGNAADGADPDGDGWTNAQEFISGTDPNSRTSLLKVDQIQASGNDLNLRFPTVLGKTYRVECSETLSGDSWITVQSGIAGTGNPIQITDTGGSSHDKRFYRIVVGE
jgi:hypothetical protein